MRHTIDITNDQNKLPFPMPYRTLIRRAVKATLKSEAFDRPCEVSVTIVDNETIHEINLEHRGIDRPTDVLSFPMFDEDFDDGEDCVLGDIVISLEKAKEQAEEYGHSFNREVAFLCVHSMLHLLGYDHEISDEDDKEMRAKQTEIMKIMGLEVK